MTINQIKQLPQKIAKERNFALKMIEYNRQILSQVNYLQQLVLSVHRNLNYYCTTLFQITSAFLREISDYQTQIRKPIGFFISSIASVYSKMNHQINNNYVTLNDKQVNILKTRQKTLTSKLFVIDQITNRLFKLIEEYNSMAQRFNEKCEYFKNFGKDVLKFYSIKKNNKVYNKIAQKEEILKQKLQNFSVQQRSLKVAVTEVRVATKQYFELNNNILKESKKAMMLFGSDQKQMNIYNQPIIQEVSQQAQQSARYKIISPHKQSKQKLFSQRKNQIIEQYNQSRQIYNKFETVIQVIKQQLIKLISNLDIETDAQKFTNFNQQRKVLNSIMPVEFVDLTDKTLKHFSELKQILHGSINLLNQSKVFKQISNYRELNFQKYLRSVESHQENQNKLQNDMFEQFTCNFQASDKEFTLRFNQKIRQIQINFIKIHKNNEYLQKQKTIDPFQNKYYQILMQKYFFEKQQNYQFQLNPHLLNYRKAINANKLQQILSTNVQQKTKRQAIGCFGCFSNTKRQSIDEFNCALKNGLILIQGKLIVYKSQFKFESSFNPYTFFGGLSIEIAKWDILKIQNEKYGLSQLLVIKTTHGKIQFTSFITDPYHIFMKAYGQKQFIQTQQILQLSQLQKVFQEHFLQRLIECNFHVDKLNTYLTQNNSSLFVSIAYRLKGQSLERGLFQIKIIKQRQISSYLFVHSSAEIDNQVKNTLQDISKRLINKKKNEYFLNNQIPQVSLFSQIYRQDNFQASNQKINQFFQKTSFNDNLLQKNKQILEGANISEIQMPTIRIRKQKYEQKSVYANNKIIKNAKVENGNLSEKINKKEEKNKILSEKIITQKQKNKFLILILISMILLVSLRFLCCFKTFLKN